LPIFDLQLPIERRMGQFRYQQSAIENRKSAILYALAV